MLVITRGWNLGGRAHHESTGPGDFAAFVGTVDPWHSLSAGKVSTRPGGFWVNLRWVNLVELHLLL